MWILGRRFFDERDGDSGTDPGGTNSGGEPGGGNFGGGGGFMSEAAAEAAAGLGERQQESSVFGEGGGFMSEVAAEFAGGLGNRQGLAGVDAPVGSGGDRDTPQIGSGAAAPASTAAQTDEVTRREEAARRGVRSTLFNNPLGSLSESLSGDATAKRRTILGAQ